MRDLFEVRGPETAIFLQHRDGIQTETLIDTEDLAKVLAFSSSWRTITGRGKRYPYVAGTATDNQGRTLSMLLHRLIMDSPKELVVDHINHDTLDNRKSNLRLVTHAENGQNRAGAASHSETMIRGVSWCKAANKWRAQVRLHGKIHYLGVYSDLHEASVVVSQWRAQHMPFSRDVIECLSDSSECDVSVTSQ